MSRQPTRDSERPLHAARGPPMRQRRRFAEYACDAAIGCWTTATTGTPSGSLTLTDLLLARRTAADRPLGIRAYTHEDEHGRATARRSGLRFRDRPGASVRGDSCRSCSHVVEGAVAPGLDRPRGGCCHPDTLVTRSADDIIAALHSRRAHRARHQPRRATSPKGSSPGASAQAKALVIPIRVVGLRSRSCGDRNGVRITRYSEVLSELLIDDRLASEARDAALCAPRSAIRCRSWSGSATNSARR